MTTPPRAAPALAAITTAALLVSATLNTTAARHSDIPDLPPVASDTATLAAVAMHNELARFQSVAAALGHEPPQPSVLTGAALASSRIDSIAAAALNELANRSALTWEFAAVLDARSSAQRRLAAVMLLHHTMPGAPLIH